MNNLDLNKLVANDIINYAIDNISDSDNTNYIINLDSYLNEFDEESKKYILDNIDDIIKDISDNESVLDLVVNNENENIELDIVFYWGKLLSQVEQVVFNNSRLLKVELDYKDIKDIANNILDDDSFNDDLSSKIAAYKNELEL